MNVPEFGSAVIAGEIAEPPPQGLELLFKTLLEANHDFKATVGSTFSIDRETGKIMLFRHLATLDIEEETFIKIIETFVNVMETWKQIIINYRDSGPKDASENSGILNTANDFMQV